VKYGESVKHFWRQLLGKERRKAERLAVPGLVAFYWDGGPPVAHPIREISLTGMYLLTEERWYLGTVVTMRLQQTESAETDPDHSIAVHAKAVRWGTDGVGMSFLPPGQNPSPNGHDPRGHGGNQKSLKGFVRQV
jgi:hypothetical protein